MASVGGVPSGVALATPFCGVQKGTKGVGVFCWEILTPVRSVLKLPFGQEGRLPLI